jgi:hypothetical protein
MKIKILIAMLCLMSTNWAVAVAASETIELGNARISLELWNLGPFSVEKGDTSSTVHKEPDFRYDIASATIKVKGSSHLVQIEVHRMSLSEPLFSPIPNEETTGNEGKISSYLKELTTYLPNTISNRMPTRRENISGLEHCLKMSNLIPRGEAIQTESYAIDKQQGFMTTIVRDKEDPRYIVAYSPDAQNGSGTTICIIGSDFPWNDTEKLFKSVEIELG